MNREIKFRGRAKGGFWHFGDLKLRKDKPNWATVAAWVVDRETVGEFTGFKDIDSKEIYEGDILEYPGKLKACVVVTDIREFVYRDIAYQFKVIGNIHDNPELLEGEQN